MPGIYTIRLIADGKTYSQPIVIKMDPRVTTSKQNLQSQLDLSLKVYNDRKKVMQLTHEIDSYREQIKMELTNTSDTTKLKALDNELSQLQNSPRGSAQSNVTQLDQIFSSLLNLLQASDMPPTTQGIEGVKIAEEKFNQLQSKWNLLKQEIKNDFP